MLIPFLGYLPLSFEIERSTAYMSAELSGLAAGVVVHVKPDRSGGSGVMIGFVAQIAGHRQL